MTRTHTGDTGEVSAIRHQGSRQHTGGVR